MTVRIDETKGKPGRKLLISFDMTETDNYQNNWPQHIDMRDEGRRDIK
jgi:hypothetical protein